ncbi:MAG: WD40/YVTN/BNR-like repeat-containing protein [bacterium]
MINDKFQRILISTLKTLITSLVLAFSISCEHSISILQNDKLDLTNKWEIVSSWPDFPAITFLSLDSLLFVGSHRQGVYSTKDNGITWHQHNTGLPEYPTVSTLAVKDDLIFLGVNSDGIFKTANPGTSWTGPLKGLPEHPRIRDLLVRKDVIFAGIADLVGVYKSTDNGESWSYSGLSKWVGSLLWHDNELFAAAAASGGVSKSSDGGQTWVTILENQVCYGFAVWNDRILVGTNEGVFISDDNGETWRPSNNGLPTRLPPNSFVVWKDYILLSSYNYGIYLSEDGGNSWSPMNEGLEKIEHFVAFGVHNNRLYLSAENFEDRYELWTRSLSDDSD